jgi:hypothetical protein
VVITVGDDPNLRLLWLLIAVLTALIVGLIAGGLSFVDDRRVAAAIIRGGVAFGATIGCMLGIYAFLA